MCIFSLFCSIDSFSLSIPFIVIGLLFCGTMAILYFFAKAAVQKLFSLLWKIWNAIQGLFYLIAIIVIFVRRKEFWASFKAGAGPILRSVPAVIIFSIVLAVLYCIVETKWFSISDPKGGKLYRQNAAGYYLLNEFFYVLKPEIILLWISWKYHIFQVSSCIGLILLFLCMLEKTCVLIGLKKRIQNWAVDAAKRNKDVCTYLSLKDFGPYFGQGNDNMSKILGPCEAASEWIGTMGMIWESEDMLICPHWLYREYFTQEDRNSRFFLFTGGIDGLGGAIEQETAVIISEFLTEGKDAAIYISKEDNTQPDEVMSHSVKRFNEKKNENDKAAQFLVAGGSMITIPYFATKEFVHPYPKNRAAIMKYDYIDEELQKIGKLEDSTECFYRLLKVIEYVWHYRALAMLAQDSQMCEMFVKDSFKSSMGLWERFQNKKSDMYSDIYTDQETVQAYCLISSLLSGGVRRRKKVSYSELCQIITQLRNRYVGHGTMAFSVSEELLEAVRQLAYRVLEIFYQRHEIIVDESKKLTIERKLTTDENEMSTVEVPLVYYNTIGQRSLCLLAGYVGWGNGVAEYLDYRNAAFRSGEIIEYQLDYREELM